MSFSITALVGNEVLVEGTDVRGNVGSIVLRPSQWVAIKRQADIDDAHGAFDAKVEEFFAELTNAVDELDQAHRVVLDPLLYVVEQEGTAGTPTQREVITELDHDSVIVRAIETGNDARVIWVNGNLTLLAQAVAPAPTVDDAIGVGELEY
jgi:hypothetical protein